MSVRYPWIGLAVIVATVAVAGIQTVRRRRPVRRRWRGEAPIANVGRAAESDLFRRMRHRQQALLAVEVVALLVAGAAAAVIAMRPVSRHAAAEQVANRDVMLCLDVSGSMAELDAAILDRFAALVDDLRGERIGLTIWNGSAVTIFPLTDDRDYVATTLADASVAIDGGDPLYLAGTIVGGSSLIADGLASCVMRFDRPGEVRARSIVLATDNAVAGQTIMSLTEAATMARDQGIRVYGVAAPQITDYDERELKDAVAITDGAYLAVDDPHVVDDLVDRILEREATVRDRAGVDTLRDDPAPWVAVAAGAVVALVAVEWALRR